MYRDFSCVYRSTKKYDHVNIKNKNILYNVYEGDIFFKFIRVYYLLNDKDSVAG